MSQLTYCGLDSSQRSAAPERKNLERILSKKKNTCALSFIRCMWNDQGTKYGPQIIKKQMYNTVF